MIHPLNIQNDGRWNFSRVFDFYNDLFKAAKYHKDASVCKKARAELICAMRKDLVDNVEVKYLKHIKIVAPVPSSSNLVTEIARSLTELTGGTCQEKALTKIRDHAKTKNIDVCSREKVLKNSIAADPSIMCDKLVLLVDDVYETGSTLREATRAAYEQGGAKSVWVYVAAKIGLN